MTAERPPAAPDEPGPLLKGPGTLGVRSGPRHSDSYRHIDLEFLLNVDRAAETSPPDCATGLAADPGEAARQARYSIDLATAYATRRQIGESLRYLQIAENSLPSRHAPTE